MASINKNFDSVGGFSVSDKTLINETFDVKDANSLEIKNNFYADSNTFQLYSKRYQYRNFTTRQCWNSNSIKR